MAARPDVWLTHGIYALFKMQKELPFKGQLLFRTRGEKQVSGYVDRHK